jgi:hypothetical protein
MLMTDAPNESSTFATSDVLSFAVKLTVQGLPEVWVKPFMWDVLKRRRTLHVGPKSVESKLRKLRVRKDVRFTCGRDMKGTIAGSDVRLGPVPPFLRKPSGASDFV